VYGRRIGGEEEKEKAKRTKNQRFREYDKGRGRGRGSVTGRYGEELQYTCLMCTWMKELDVYIPLPGLKA
jgi:hypothetical protein